MQIVGFGRVEFDAHTQCVGRANWNGENVKNKIKTQTFSDSGTLWFAEKLVEFKIDRAFYF